MSLRTLPLLFFNLGGEMLYILEQRLRAQQVLPEKANKVMLDIVGHMFFSKHIEELFKPQKVLSKRSLRAVFERIAHTSIMKLNHTAMDKLYDLMLMGVKYQFLLCKNGKEMIMVTFNHLDTIREFVRGSDEHVSLINAACKKITECYSELSVVQFLELRCTLLSFFQDIHKRVSIFLKAQTQLQNGHFVIPLGGPLPIGFEPPGTIRYFRDGQVSEERCVLQYSYEPVSEEGSWELEGPRFTTLGCNMYVADRPDTTESPLVAPSYPPEVDEEEDGEEKERKNEPTNSLAKAELDLLERLLVGMKPLGEEQGTFKLKLWEEEEEEERSASKMVQIDAVKKGKAELNRIMQEMTVTEGSMDTNTEEESLLDLLDQA